MVGVLMRRATAVVAVAITVVAVAAATTGVEAVEATRVEVAVDMRVVEAIARQSFVLE
jgi:hypothetical protein